ncbi:MAG: cobyrinate a,c-diamide synthase [Blastocatellia bacterium]
MVKSAPQQTRVLVVSGTHSGAGKTTIATALMAAYSRRGLRVRAFKVGPDFIDPGFHHTVTGHPSRNLDGWMMGHDAVLDTFRRGSSDADISIVEGVMGLFDGASGTSESGSTGEIAKWLGAPVVLVIDASALARSAAAIVRGFEDFDRDLNVASVVANRVAGKGHYGYIEPAIQNHCRAVPVGWMPSDPSIRLPERHLGLVTAAESLDAGMIDRLGYLAEQSIDLDRLLSISCVPAASDSPARLHGEQYSLESSAGSGEARVRIGVALDRAFCFYYQDNLDMLERLGAELIYWSPIQDSLPSDLAGLYFGGGYPELYAEQLSANAGARDAVKCFIDRGGPVYAECGGLMYLTEAIMETGDEQHDGDCQDRSHRMVGAFPTVSRMRNTLAAIGYTEVSVSPKHAQFLTTDCVARGHQFRYSEIDPMPAEVNRCYRARSVGNRAEFEEGYLINNCLASYVHLHFSSCPALAESWIKQCRTLGMRT